MFRAKAVLFALLVLILFVELPADAQLNRRGHRRPPRPQPVVPGVTVADPRFAEVDRLINEQKFGEALEATKKILGEARAKNDSTLIAETLIRATQLQLGLHGYETAVRFLKEEKWPSGAQERVLLHLYYGQALSTYHQSYSYEINKREKTVSSDTVDLRAWTTEQIGLELARAFDAAMKDEAAMLVPLSELAKKYIRPNNYPPGVRPFFRDAVVYMATRFLIDTRFWKAQDSGEVYRLPLGKLARGEAAPAKPAVADDKLHPLLRVAGILNRHREIHAGASRREAALEARYELIRALYQRADQMDDKREIEKALREIQAQKGHRELPWWSTGQAMLAGYVQGDASSATHLIEAVKIAREGVTAYPNSQGGRECQVIVETILRPELQFMAMDTDAMGKPSILVTHKEVRKAWFRAYSWDLDRQMKEAPMGQLWSFGHRTNRRFEDLLAGELGKPVATWSVDLPATEDHMNHRTLVTPPMKAPGAYIIVVSAREDFGQENNVVAWTHMITSDLVLRRQALGDGTYEMRALSGATGKSLAGVEITSWGRASQNGWSSPAVLRETVTTGSDGTAVIGRKGSGRPSHADGEFQIGRFDNQVAVMGDQAWIGQRDSREAKTAELFVFTDRSVFRPEQTLHWKALGYQGSRREGSFTVAADRSVEVELRDANNQVVAKKTAKTNEFGTAAGDFAIPAGRALGNWMINARFSDNRGRGFASVMVEEYKRPTFEATFLPPEKPLRLNQKAAVKGEARYYFGLPVAAGKVGWRVRREPVYSWFWGDYFGYSRGGRREATSEIIASGAASLKDDGTFAFEFTPEADEREGKDSGTTYRFLIEADVTDEGGETRQASKSVRLGFVALEARIEANEGFYRDANNVEIPILLTDLDGIPQKGQGKFRIHKLESPRKTLLPAEMPRGERSSLKGSEKFETPGDRKRSRWETEFTWAAVTKDWKESAKAAEGSLAHDAKGRAVASLPRSQGGGAYRITYETKDAFGAPLKVSRDILVADAKETRFALPLLLVSEKSSYKVGETARYLVASGVEKQPAILEVFLAGRRVQQKPFELGGGAQLFEVPVEDKHRGGFSVSLRALSDHQEMSQRVDVGVPWDNKQLTVELASFRDKIRPGTKETVRIVVKDVNGKSLSDRAAEVLSYMYDRSLDIFRSHATPSLSSIYPARAGLPDMRVSLGAVWGNAQYQFPYPSSVTPLLTDELYFHDSYGIGGMGSRGQMLFKSASRARGEMADNFAGLAAPAPGGAPAAESLQEGRADGAAMKKSDMSAKEEERQNQAVGNKGGAAPAADAPVTMRSDFSETAFWRPHLIAGADGSVSFEYQVPDSLTSWSFWAFATTKDMRSGSVSSQTQSSKDLMVRPYLPRFLREGDAASIRVAVNNASEAAMSGEVQFEIEDLATGASVLGDFGLAAADAKRSFNAPKGGADTLVFKVRAPRKVASYAFKVVAKSGAVSDGERRPLPVLPSRMHLAQSRFVTLRNKDQKTMVFKDLAQAASDPTMEQDRLVVTVDAQLFYGVLQSLPYLVTYPYECTEQTLNRFLATGIVSSVFKKYPAIEKMAQEFSKRDSRLEKFDKPDPNQRMTLEESPWLQQAKGGAKTDDPLVNVLDSRIAKAERDRSLAKLRKAQGSRGGFPWFQGGPESEYITLYLLLGFARAHEFGVDVPKDMIANAWRFMRSWVDGDLERCMRHGGCHELTTMLGFALSSYPDLSWTGGVFSQADQKRLVDYSFERWKQHSPLIKGYLTLVLKRMKRESDAKLVWASVMDSAKSNDEQGTFWAPEERSWLWYNDTIESHAFALRVQMELAPQDKKNDGLVQWLFLNKKLNHWKSTRATAESIYSLVHFLEKTAGLGVREEIRVAVGSQTTHFVFEPDKYTGAKNQIVIDGPKIDPKTSSKIEVSKSTPGFAFASSTWHYSTDRLPQEARGDFFSVTRKYFLRELAGKEWTLKPLAPGQKINVGDQIEVHLSLKTKHEAEYVHLRDPRGAGFEPEAQTSGYRYDLGIARYEEVRDSGANFFFSWLPVGEYTFKYRVRANMAGTFRVGPATVQSLYAPEFNAFSEGHELKVEDAK